jgi:hypothetical protein
MVRIGQVLLPIGCAVLLWAPIGAATSVSVDIEAQPAEHALTAWAHQSGLQVLFPAAPRANAPGVSLKRLFVSSALKYEFIDPRTVAAPEILILGPRTANADIRRCSDDGQPYLNAIPLSSMDRIEVLPPPASGIYGGKAISGVVNVVLRRDYRVRRRSKVKRTEQAKSIRGGGGGNARGARTERLDRKRVEEAIAWVVRLYDGDKSCAAEFLKWYFADPRNASAFDPIRRTWARTRQLKAAQLFSIEERCQSRDSLSSLACAAGCLVLLAAVPVAIDLTGILMIGAMTAPLLWMLGFFLRRFDRCRKDASAARLAIADRRD